ncbi:MAG: glycosyltransferase [Caulobacteraceae bacterium]
MSRRLTIGLRYTRQEHWVGGFYYVQNLVRALALLPEGRRPRLVMIGGDAPRLDELRRATGYPGLSRVSRTRLVRAPASGMLRRLIGPREEEIDVILLGSSPGLEDRAVQWIPDFQEERFPDFFAPEELAARRAHNREVLAAHLHVMVSSRDCAEELARAYGRAGPDVHVIRFASFVAPELAGVDPAAVRARYGIEGRYLICANQFWKHKNHALVLRALAQAGPAALPVVFTGREEDPRDSAYGPSVRLLARELGVEDRCRFLGFLPRPDQLALMAGAVAVVQPSLSEGWSTVIEDAKALGRWVLASDIPLHREQVDRNVDVFPAARCPGPGGLDASLRRRRSRCSVYGLCRGPAPLRRRSLGHDRGCGARFPPTADAADRGQALTSGLRRAFAPASAMAASMAAAMRWSARPGSRAAARKASLRASQSSPSSRGSPSPGVYG